MKTILIRLTLILFLLFPAGASSSDKVFVYNWTEYIPDKVIQQFIEETGIKVIYTTYESNETMYAKLKLIDGAGYDVVFPSTYYVNKMAKEGLLHPVDHEKVPNIAGLDPLLMNKDYDPGNNYSIPYMWGSTGIAVNTEILPVETVTSWKDLWNKEYSGQLLLHDDLREVFHVALSIKGYSSNTRNPKEIEEAYLLLKELMPNVLLFNSDSPRLPYLAGEASIGMIWNGEVFMAQEENPAIAYIYPNEGANFWVDSFVIPKGAKNVENAHKFINFMLRPDIAKLCVETVGFATPVLTALPLLEEQLRNNPIIFPSKEIVQAGEFQTDVGEALPIYQKYWEELRSGN